MCPVFAEVCVALSDWLAIHQQLFNEPPMFPQTPKEKANNPASWNADETAPRDVAGYARRLDKKQNDIMSNTCRKPPKK